MRRAFKNSESKIVTENLSYVVGNSNNNRRIANILLKEQKNFCAYTDEYISITDQGDIDHFNPTIKGTDDDNYYNWFVVKTLINKKKGNKWKKFQPILDPTSIDFEERIIYVDGDYIAKSETDVEVNNLINLLGLNNAVLADKRKRYIRRKREHMKLYNQSEIKFFKNLIECSICELWYPRAIKEEFGVDVFQML